MPGYDGYTLAQVRAAIEPGQPSTVEAAAGVFGDVAEALGTLADEIASAVSAVTTTGAWSGPAATAFVTVADNVAAFATAVMTPLAGYEAGLDGAATALAEAQTKLAAYVAQVSGASAAAPGAAVDTEAIDAGARAILVELAAVYSSTASALAPVPTSPRDVVVSRIGQVGAQLGLVSPEDVADLPGSDQLAVAGLVPVDLGRAGLLTLGRTTGTADPTTLLAGLGGTVHGIPVAQVSTSGPFTPLADLSGLRGTVLPPGAVSAATHLTTAPGSVPGDGLPPAVGTSRGPYPPLGSPLAGQPAGRSRASRAPISSALGRAEEEDEGQERSAALVGDQTWDDGAGLTVAIGRTGSVRPAGE